MRFDPADRIVLTLVGKLDASSFEGISDRHIRWLRDAIRAEINEAVQIEREACAKIAESMPLRDLIAARIRVRGEIGHSINKPEESPTPS
jgi:hypothetical protein